MAERRTKNRQLTISHRVRVLPVPPEPGGQETRPIFGRSATKYALLCTQPNDCDNIRIRNETAAAGRSTDVAKATGALLWRKVVQ